MSKQKPAPAPAPEDDSDRREQLPAVPENAGRAISGWLSVQEILARKRLIEAVMKEVMKEGEHYGPSFPGDKKLNLLKPGADTLLSVFQLVASSEYVVIDLPGGHREYRVRAPIETMSGSTVAIGLGSCSTMEKKYRWRWASPTCPSCKRDALMKSRYGSGWYCNPKKQGCGANIPEDKVVAPLSPKVENEDIADVYNTCLKIAKKRAIVDGTLSATGCSDIFGQDAEDTVDKDKSDEDGHATTQRQDQGKRDAGSRSAPSQPAAAAEPVQPAAPAAAPAAAAAAAAAKLEADLTAEYGKLQNLGDKGTAAKFWRFWPDKAVRLDGIRRANVALKAIADRLGDKAEQLLRDILLDRQNPDDVLGILADLEKAAPPPAPPRAAPAPAADDQPPF